jgi:RNA polymerase sigma factor (sigma-70 family)
MELDQALLLEAFRAGSKAAFEQVFRAHYRSLHLQAYLLLKSEEEAEDQVQQLFLDMWNKQAYSKVQTSIKAYLHAALRNQCLNYLNRMSVHRRLRDEYTGLSTGEPQQEAVFQDEDDAQSGLLSILKEMPMQRLRAFNLVHLQDKKYQDAAKEMGISVNSLKTHIKLAIRFLRMRLG